MYQVSIFNNNVETIIHFPSSNKDDPHVPELPLKEELSVVDILSLKLYPNNEGYNRIFELTTIVKIIDIRDNTIRFTGRILDISENMDSSGVIYKSITCEGAMSYLNDTKLRGSSYTGTSVADFLNQILQVHNSKVELTKQIRVGNVDVAVTSNVIHTCSYKTVLAELLIVRDTIGGELHIREVDNVLYLDWLTNIDPNTLEVTLGVNMKDMIISKDVTSLGTRIIPLGANNLTIETVNGGLDYLEDLTAKNIYGVIEKTVEYKDIEDPAILKVISLYDLTNHTQPSYLLGTSALDLSFITGNKSEQFMLGTKLHIVNEYMNVDAVYTIVSLNLDLLNPYNPQLTMSNKQTTLSTTINDLRNSTIQNDGVYNNVQIGSSYGIRAVKSDGKTITTMNATEGIRIQTDRGHGLVDSFYVDVNGNLKVNTYDEITGELTSGLSIASTKISAVVESNDGGASWELADSKFKLAFGKAGGGYTEIDISGLTINDGKFKIKKGGSTVFYVNTSGRCTADGGFRVDDDATVTNIDANGIHMTNENGYTGSLQVSDISELYIPDDLKINSSLDVGELAKFRGSTRFYGNTWVTDNDGGGDLDVDDDLWVGDDLDVVGTKNCLQSTEHYGHRRINAYETAEYYFGDIGNGVIRDGECIIYIDDVFSECINTNIEYQVEIFEYTQRGSIISVDRQPNYFIVKGNFNDVLFGWELKAKRKGYENNRLESKPDKYNMATSDFENSLLKTNIEDYSNVLLMTENLNVENILLEEVI